MQIQLKWNTFAVFIIFLFSGALPLHAANSLPQLWPTFSEPSTIVALPHLPDELGRFHAQYRQSAPCRGQVSDGKNLSGRDNYVFLEATGKGHYVGVTQSVLQNQTGWFGEGDDMIFIDGDPVPTINGTGTEDYFNGAWGFGGQPYADLYVGSPYIVDPE